MNDITELPPGWNAIAWPAEWRPDEDDGPDLTLERVGYVLLPTQFFLAISPPDDSPEPKKAPTDDFRAFILGLRVKAGELIIQQVQAIGVDLSNALDALVDAVPPDRWKPIAVAKVTEFLAFDEKRQPPPVMPSSAVAEAPVAATRRGAPQRKHHRITKDHLMVVSKIYSNAKEDGRAPTRAVQEHFNVSHSTAAKWVGAARREGFLPPVGASGATTRPTTAEEREAIRLGLPSLDQRGESTP